MRAGGSQISRRLVQTRDMVRDRGLQSLLERAIRKANGRWGDPGIDFPLLPGDIRDSHSVFWPSTDPLPEGQSLRIAWLMTPPGPGSGGHTTLFRMIAGLESAGHTCLVLLYDRYGSPVEYHASVIRQHWPHVQAQIVDARQTTVDVDAYVATSWPTAHVLAARSEAPGQRFYFVQDYEPYFYPAGSESSLAADTYSFGFHIIAIGGMIAEILKERHGVDVERIPFGCDRSVYSLTNLGDRNGVVFYAKPQVPRRGYHLGVAALEIFHNLHPEQSIHIFGDQNVRLPFPATVHGTVAPARLAEIYNKVRAGLSLSFTNISLVPYEMLACGVVPVMNKSTSARNELGHPEVRWADATPTDIARALSSVCDSGNPAERARRAADRGDVDDWSTAQATFVRAIEKGCHQQPFRVR